jgi:pimeloyl-ACP methyl ester carboxylesterase
VNDAQCVSFPNRRGFVLHGMLHSPPAGIARGCCVLLLSPGIKGRIGPHRLYLKLAERLVPMGFHVLRFDFHGLGDSEGDAEETVLADLYHAIQVGRYVDDTLDAMDWMASTHRIDRFIGSGLCGGSITALLAASRDARIRALLGIGLPVILDGGERTRGRFLTSQQTREARGQLFSRILRPWTWAKFFTGRSNYRVIWRVTRQVFGGKDKGHAVSSEAPAAADDTNPLAAPAFLDLLRSGRPALLTFSEADRLLGQFHEKLESRHRAQLEPYSALYRVHVVAQANHILSDPAWMADLLDVTQRWLDDVWPAKRDAKTAGMR